MSKFKSRRRKLNNKRKRRLILNASLLLVFFIGMGYSLLGNNLGIFGSLTVKEYLEPTLYNVLKKEALIGTYAKEYTGEHQDSMAGVGDKAIYHWYAPSTTAGDTLAEEILDKNNVIFAGHCWQMIRTTDTGGVKMIYNGEPNNGKCNNTGEASTIGKSKFNQNDVSLADIGYMYNTRYMSSTKNNKDDMSTAANISTTYWYADNVSWNSNTKKYELINPYQISSTDDYPSLVGKYTFGNQDQSYTYSTVKYIVKINNSTASVITMERGNYLNYYNHIYTYGSSYTDNGDGTYTINSPSTINRIDYVNDYSNLYGKYVCKDAINDTCTDLWYVMNPDTSNIYYSSILENYKYSQGFTYNNGTYTLNDDNVTIWDYNKRENLDNISNHHYTCWNETGECTTISYVFYGYTYSLGYINLTDGKSIDDIVDEMLYDDNVNTINSTIKTYIDTWYQNNMINYTDFLENTIFCNNRSQNNSNGWNPNGSIRDTIYFLRRDLNCPNMTDRFSVDNPNAHLDYSIGLATYGELYLLTNIKLRTTGASY